MIIFGIIGCTIVFTDEGEVWCPKYRYQGCGSDAETQKVGIPHVVPELQASSVRFVPSNSWVSQAILRQWPAFVLHRGSGKARCWPAGSWGSPYWNVIWIKLMFPRAALRWRTIQLVNSMPAADDDRSCLILHKSDGHMKSHHLIGCLPMSHDKASHAVQQIYFLYWYKSFFYCRGYRRKILPCKVWYMQILGDTARHSAIAKMVPV